VATAAALASAVAAALLAVAVIRRRGRRPRPGPARRGSTGARSREVPVALLAAMVCASAPALAATARDVAADAGPLPSLAAQRAAVRVEAVVVADPRRARPRPGAGWGGPKEPVLVVELRVEVVTGRGVSTRVRSPVVALADSTWAELLPGTRVSAAGRAATADDDATTAVLLIRGPPEILSRAGSVQRVAGDLREGLRQAVAGLEPKERGLVPGLVVGDTSALPPELEETFRTAGLTHLVAVSGANVAIVCGAVLAVMLGLGVGRRFAAVAAFVALLAFGVLARPQPSVLRAGVMGAVGLLALMSGRRRAAVPALAAAVLLLLMLDPGLARSYGFALSVLATAGIVLLAGPWTAALRSRRIPLPLAAALAVPAAAQVACSPVIAMLAGQVNLVAVVANMLAAPAVPPATLAGVAAAVTAPVSADLAAVLGRLAGLPATWIVLVAERSAAVPYAAVPWPDGPGGAGALVLVGLLVAASGVALVRLTRLLPRWAALGSTVVLVAAVLVARSSPEWPPPGWLLVACDVGQGDALVLHAGAGSAVVVDAGPDPESVDRCLKRLGVERVPLLVLSHFHADHIDGLAGVLRGRAVGEISVGPLDEPSGAEEAVAAAARSAGVAVTRAVAGERRAVDQVSWQVVWPGRLLRGEGSEANNASVVMLVEVAGVRILLTGDVEAAAQHALQPVLADALAGRPLDVLKVAHHGSASQSAPLVTGLRPRVAVISVGAGNTYGHPAPEAMSLLAATGAAVWRTDESGDVAVVGSAERLRVVGRDR
jgi:competence protein ComEC